MTDTMHNYYLAWISTEAYSESSADPVAYWGYPADERFEGYALMKREHPYRTVTGKVIRAPRLLKRNPTLADLWRLRHAGRAVNPDWGDAYIYPLFRTHAKATAEHLAEHRARAVPPANEWHPSDMDDDR